MQIEERPELTFPGLLGVHTKVIGHFSYALQGLRRAVDAAFMGLSERHLRSVPKLLRTGTDFVAAPILPSAGLLEVFDGNRGKTPPMRVLPKEFRQLPAV